MSSPWRVQNQRGGHDPPPPSPSSPEIRSDPNFSADSYSHRKDVGETSTCQPHRNQFLQMQTQQLQQQQSQRIENLLKHAQSSYSSYPTDALSSLMEALTIRNGPVAAEHAMNRIRTELGSAVADCVAINIKSRCQHLSIPDTEMTQRALEIVNEMLNDTSTFLHEQGKQRILQEAMEDGSSVVCVKCGDMIKAERWNQHAEYWCRDITDTEDIEKKM